MDGTGKITTPVPAPKTPQVLDAKGKARLQKAVKDFEAIFMGMMMQSMRSTVPKDEASGESFGNDAMESLFDAEVAKRMAGRSNLGLAEMLYRSITKESLNAPDPVTTMASTLATTLARTEALQSAPRTEALQSAPATMPARIPGKLAPNVGGTAALTQAPNLALIVSPAPSTMAPNEALQSAPRTTASQGAPRTQAPQGAPRTPAPEGAPTKSPVNAPSRPAPASAAGPWNSGPSASTLQRIAAYENIIQEAAAKHGVDSTMLKAVIAAESAGNSNAVSPKDAKGLMQLTDTTAADMGVRNVWNPGDNIQGGARYLRLLIERFPGDTQSVIASYNAGPARVGKHGGVPPIPETQAYVRRVMKYMDFFEQKEASHEGR